MSLWQYFATKVGKKATYKWTQYFPIYERYFSEWKNKSLTFLEIGTYKGGSLEMWRNYFSPLAKIISIDINPECAKLQSYGTFVRIGDQSDPEFLQCIVDEFGIPDIVLDDGSHQQTHIQATFNFFLPPYAQEQYLYGGRFAYGILGRIWGRGEKYIYGIY